MRVTLQLWARANSAEFGGTCRNLAGNQMLPVVDCAALARNRDRRTGRRWVSRWCSLRRKDDNRFFVFEKEKGRKTRSVTALRRDRRADREDFVLRETAWHPTRVPCPWSSCSDPFMHEDFYNIRLQTSILACPIWRVELETHYLLDPMGCILVSTKFDLIWCNYLSRFAEKQNYACQATPLLK